MIVKIKKLEHFDEDLVPPFYASAGAAGADILACFPDKESIEILPNERKLIPTGISLEIPVGFEIQVRPRSGLSLKTPLLIVNSPGTIDSDYRGEVKIIIGNLGNKSFIIEHGLKIAQLVVAKVYQAEFQQAETLSTSQRGNGAFGSTGAVWKNQ